MDSSLIQKKLISPGKKTPDFLDGSKITFHIKTETVKEGTVIDDSKSWKEPVELILGKKFKLECWEACVRTMAIDEISSFDIDKSLVTSYAIVARTLRDHYAKKQGKKVEPPNHHCCGLSMNESLGYPDLDVLLNRPQDLRFTIDLQKVENPGSYNKEYWAMSESEQLSSIPTLREEGNTFYKDAQYTQAAKSYSEAIGRLENLMLKEKPGEEEWTEFNNKKLPLLLNFAQCQHLAGEFYSVIEHCTSVLEHDPENIKALFRRGRAYIEVFSPAEAKADLNRAMELDKTCAPNCKKLLAKLNESEKEKLSHDKEAFKKLFAQ